MFVGRPSSMAASQCLLVVEAAVQRNKGYSLLVVQHTASCQIKSKSNTTQTKAVPQSHTSIIPRKNGRRLYDSPTSIIHAFIKKDMQRGNEQIFQYLWLYSSRREVKESSPITASTLHWDTNAEQRTNQGHSFVHILTGSRIPIRIDSTRQTAVLPSVLQNN